MIKQLENLTAEERGLLYKAPVFVSVLASCSFKEVNRHRKADAIKLAHLKTYTAAPLLLTYYAEVEKNFEKEFEIALEKYYPFDERQQSALRKELKKINMILQKVDIGYAAILHKSFEKYAQHVKKAAHSVFQDFIFPIPINGLSA